MSGLCVAPLKFGVCLLSLLILAGCAGGSPNTVQPSGMETGTGGLVLPTPENPMLGAALMAGTLRVDATSLTATLIPDHQGALDFPLDITPYLTISPGFDCFRALSVKRGPGGTIDLELGLRHPFDPALRPDLDPFDPRLILGTGGATQFGRLPLGKDGAAPRVTLQGVPNADGYTGRFKELVGTTQAGTKNPYIDFFTDTNPDPLVIGAQVPFHRMAAGAPEDRQILRLNPAVLGNVIELRWIIEAAYGQSATRANRFSPVYRNPQFNRKEPYAVRVQVVSNTLQEGEVNTEATVLVEVEDWQQGAPVAADPENPAPNEVEASSDFSRLIFDLPGLTPATIQRNAAESGSGTAGDPFRFTFDITNDGTFTAGSYAGLVLVEDELDPFTADLEYRVFQSFSLTVLEENPPPQKGTWDWSGATQQVSQQPGLSYLWPKEGIAIDSLGRSHVVWTDDSSGNDQAFYARQTSPGATTFTSAEALAPAPSLYPTIAIDSTDQVHVVWEDGRGLANGSNIRYASRLATGNVNAGEIPLTSVAENVFAIFPKVAIRPGGGAHVVWAENRTDPQVNPFGVADFGVYYAQVDLPSINSPGVGTAAAVIDVALSQGFPNLVAVGGTVHVAYQENALNGTGNRRVWHIAGDGATFGTPVAVTNAGIDAGQPDLDATSLGVLWLVCSRGGASGPILLTSSDDSGATWNPITTFSEGGTPGYTQYGPDIAIDVQDNLHVVWHEFLPATLDLGRVQQRTQYFDGELLPTQFVTPAGEFAGWPSLAVAPNRNLAVAYQRWTGTDYEVFHQVGVYTPTP
ncbi:MAG: hypothetical protein GEEBNDBF_02390 [bacterium]|nr:hypothetical protein [bacterium]